MVEYLKKIGVGKRGFKNLTYEEAYKANKKILNGEATDVQLGAFWSAMRIKYSTVEELKGFIDALREETKFIETTDFQPLDLATNYDGKVRSFHILPASIFIATGAGVKVVGHGSDKVPSKFGSTYYDILKEMGCDLLSDEELILKSIELSGFGFYHQKYLNPKLYALLEKRREFGLRTFLNTVEKLLNPFKTTKVLVSFSHGNFVEKYLQLAKYVGFEDVFVIKGLEGGVEPFPDKETKVYTNKIFSITIHPTELNKNLNLKREISPTENAQICLSVLKNENVPFKDWAIITAGLLIYAGGKGEDIKEAIEIAEDSLSSGAAYESFIIYKSLTAKSKATF